MRKATLLLAAMVSLCLPVFGQNFTTITASAIQDASGGLLAAGKMSLIASNASGQPIAFRAVGGGQVFRRPITCSVTNGTIASGCHVANTALTNPANICFRLSITESGGVQAQVMGGDGYNCVQPTGATFNLDNYVPSGAPGVLVVSGPPGVGVPTGGSLGQSLVKNSATDYDFIWQTITGGPGGGTPGAPGAPNILSIGTVSTGPSAATITGTSPAQVLNLTLQQGIQGIPGTAAVNGTNGSNGTPGTPGTNGTTPTATQMVAALAGQDVAVRSIAASATVSAPTVTTIKSGTYLVIVGDSKCQGSTLPIPSTQRWSAILPTLSQFSTQGTLEANMCVGGSTIEGMVAAYLTDVQHYATTSGHPTILFVATGTNSISAGDSAATAFGLISAYWAQAKADGFSVVAFTISPRYAANNLNATQEPARIAYNSLVRSAPRGSYDLLFDEDQLFPNASDSNFFSDGLHLTVNAHAAMAQHLNTMFGGRGTQTVISPMSNQQLFTVTGTPNIQYFGYAPGSVAATYWAESNLSSGSALWQLDRTTTLDLCWRYSATNCNLLAAADGTVSAYRAMIAPQATFGGTWIDTVGDVIFNNIAAGMFWRGTGGLTRWAYHQADTESGSNSGSNFYIERYTDPGAFIGHALMINRATGLLQTWGDIASTTKINSGTGFQFNGTNGYTGPKTAGTCVLTIQGGIITNVTGC